MNEAAPIAHIEQKFFEYERIEQRILVLSSPQIGGSTISPNTRLYFGANKTLKGKRVVSIDVNIPNALVAFETPYNGGLIISNQDSIAFYFTLVDIHGHEAVKDLPLRALINAFNGGKRRIFNIIPDIEKSYVQTTVPFGNNDIMILFDFYTIDS